MADIALGLCIRSCKFDNIRKGNDRANEGDRADIEQEVNGLYSFDRKAKLDVAQVRAINERAQKEYYSKHSP